MRDAVRILRKEFDSRKKVYQQTVCTCDRCGLSADDLLRFSRQIELHHIRSIASLVDAGITDPSVVNGRSNISVLCSFCHAFWHKIAEPMGVTYEDFMLETPEHLKYL